MADIDLPPPDRLQAFTRSEVIITLMIIGIVASLTLPEMIADWQKQATAVQLKKVYSTIVNAFNMSIAQNGPTYTWQLEPCEWKTINGKSTWFCYDRDEQYNKYVLQYFNIAKMCKFEKNDICNYDVEYVVNSSIKITEPGGLYIWDDYDYRFILNDGSIILIDHFMGGELCYVFVDINGPKKPNRVGRDIFMFEINRVTYDGFFELSPVDDFRYEPPKNREEWLEECQYDKYYCAGLIMADGWQIKDDYPW